MSDFESQVFIRCLDGKTVVFKANEESTIGDIKLTIFEKCGLNVTDQMLRYGRTLLKNDKDKLDKYAIKNLSHLDVCGGIKGGMKCMAAITGPDTNSPLMVTPLQEVRIGETATSRAYERGANLRFEHNKKSVIGVLGFGQFDIARDYKKAYCARCDVYCSSLSKVKRLEFFDCTVQFHGELYQTGEEIQTTKTFEGIGAWFFTGKENYAWLTLTVKPLPNIYSLN